MSLLPPPTGERVIEEHYVRSQESYLIYLMHLATYRFVRPYVGGKDVLDMGCGTGYGTALLAPECRSILGVDISEEAIRYASAKYYGPNLAFKQIRRIEDQQLSLEDGSFDAIISFQVIEHIAAVDIYLTEIRRLLKPGGVLVVATPDRETRLLPFQRPWNRFHVTEYSAKSLLALLSTRFSEPKLWRMSGARSVIDLELKRTARLKWLTLPFTLPSMPERLRQHGLSFLKRLQEQRRVAIEAIGPFEFTEDDIQIGENVSPSVNLIVVARKM